MIIQENNHFLCMSNFSIKFVAMIKDGSFFYAVCFLSNTMCVYIYIYIYDLIAS